MTLSELRLVPAALTAWLATAVGLLTRSPGWALVIVAAAALIMVAVSGQSLLIGGIAGSIVAAADVRRRAAEAIELPRVIVGRLATHAPDTVARLRVPGLPDTLTVFTEEPVGLSAGTEVIARVQYDAADHPGLIPVVAHGTLNTTGEPPHGWVHHVRTTFAEAVSTSVAGDHRGLIPGMVLGDTSLQPPAAADVYVATGLSHLSAVSGSNVAIITTTAVVLCRLLTLGPRAQVGAAGLALTAFTLLVGPQPSVLRAALTGLVGLVAVVASSRMTPLHALSLAILVLLLVQPGLAVDLAFALSVSATAGIVCLSPLFSRVLWRALPSRRAHDSDDGSPGVVCRAIGVAVAADVVTLPLIALATGEVSTVSILANLLVAPVTAPITVLGMVAAVVALLPGGAEAVLLVVVSPLSWWVHTVATTLSALPFSTVPASTPVVALGYGWFVAGAWALDLHHDFHRGAPHSRR
ncbi:ComEC/Rec2 family competence protein [Corynebacterium uterequi]|uniref:ComEC/Rec2-related protein n=1 Tax=Corynebacterium uterequi TaxID=1072256 RepID=A0A0G3HIB2_9CORY|nr:ComEC/Rec2 family competence protein [Corynebacterium uterequi]AKK11618.1 ComEC/Rec2-related protein [Corynebacterium uterequi]